MRAEIIHGEETVGGANQRKLQPTRSNYSRRPCCHSRCFRHRHPHNPSRQKKTSKGRRRNLARWTSLSKKVRLRCLKRKSLQTRVGLEDLSVSFSRYILVSSRHY